MIHNDKELKATQQRIAYFQDLLLLQLRVKATPEEFPLISSGYRTEIEKMQDEVLEYLSRHSCEPIQNTRSFNRDISEKPMSHTKIPQPDSIEELTQFWNTHDLTDLTFGTIY